MTKTGAYASVWFFNQETIQPCGNDAAVRFVITCLVITEARIRSHVNAHRAERANNLRGAFAVYSSPGEEAVVRSHWVNARRNLIAEDDVVALLLLRSNLLSIFYIRHIWIQALHQHCNHVDAPAV